MTIDYRRFKAHPTKFGGRQYRSRLEARWAAFFTIAGWSFEYEPCDLSGWVPDFEVHGRPGLLVEVKPIARFDPEVAGKMQRAAGAEASLLLVGTSMPTSTFAGLRIGWTPNTGWGLGWGEAVCVGIRVDWRDQSRVCPFGIISAEGSYADRISGVHDGDNCIDADVATTNRIRLAWVEAGNAVQWRAPK